MLDRGFVIGDRFLSLRGDTLAPWMVTHATIGSYLITGASTVGKQPGDPNWEHRTDAFSIRGVGPWVAVAVSSGKEPREYAHYGSTFLVESLTTNLLRSLVPTLDTIPKTVSEHSNLSPDLTPPPMTEDIRLSTPYSTESEFISPVTELDLTPPASEIEVQSQNTRKERFKPWFDKPCKACKKLLELSPSFKSDTPKKQPENIEVNDHSTNEPMYQLQQSATTGWWAQSLFDHQTTNDQSGSKSDAQNLPKILTDAFQEAHAGLEQQAKNLDLDIADLNCSALAFLFNVDTGGGIVGRIGNDISFFRIKSEESEQPLKPRKEDRTLNQLDALDSLDRALIDKRAEDKDWAFVVVTNDSLLKRKEDASYQEDYDQWLRKNVVRKQFNAVSPPQAAGELGNLFANLPPSKDGLDRTMVSIALKREAVSSFHQDKMNEPETINDAPDSHLNKTP